MDELQHAQYYRTILQADGGNEMTKIETIRDILQADGYQVTLAAVEGEERPWAPLVVPFRPDAWGREMVLFIEVMPYGAGDDTTLVNFCLLYPLEFIESEPTAELVRAVWLLNRYLPLGYNAICEQTPAVFYAYQLMAKAHEQVDAAIIREIVDMIAYFTRQHGEFLGSVAAGEADCDDFLAEMDLIGTPMIPLIARLDGVSSEPTASS